MELTSCCVTGVLLSRSKPHLTKVPQLWGRLYPFLDHSDLRLHPKSSKQNYGRLLHDVVSSGTFSWA